MTWKTSQKTGDDIYHYLVKTGATMDGNNQLVGNTGAWKSFGKYDSYRRYKF